MDRRQFLSSSAMAAAGLVLPGRPVLVSSAKRPPGDWQASGTLRGRRPNIVLMLADDLGYADLGVQGCPDIPTPNVDSLAQHGTRFTDAYVTCPVCSPTRAGLMTGRYQQRFGHETNPGPQDEASPAFGLPRSETTFAERMKALGYRTGLVGKWHLGFTPELQPTRRGFDEFFGFLGGAHAYLPAPRQAQILRGTGPIVEKEYLTDAFAREAAAFITAHRRDPFFLYLAFNAVHAPMQAAEKYRSRFTAIKDDTRRTHAAMLTALDDGVGLVLKTLRDHDLERDTLVVFLSDNGGPTPQTTSSNAPLRGYKGQMWEGGIRIPFIVQWKGRLPEGRVDRRPVVSLDLLPTSVAAAGGEVSPDWKQDGFNLLPLLAGQAKSAPHDTLCWRMLDKHAIRHGDWKLVVETGQPRAALFNLAEDVSEKRDLAGAMPEKVKELQDRYRAWDDQMIPPAWGRGGGRAGLGRGAQVGAAERRFKQLDANGDGKLTPAELGRPRVFRQMDANGDGVVTLEELRAYLRGRGGPGACP